MQFSIEDPKNHERLIPITREVSDAIIKNYLMKTYYWTVAFSCLIIGFLVGVIVKSG